MLKDGKAWVDEEANCSLAKESVTSRGHYFPWREVRSRPVSWPLGFQEEVGLTT